MRWQDRFLIHMEREGLTQTEVAKRLEMTQGGVGHWLSGRREPTLKAFIKLCRVAGANAQYVLFGDNQEQQVIGKIKELLSAEPEKSPTYHQFEGRVKAANKARRRAKA